MNSDPAPLPQSPEPDLGPDAPLTKEGNTSAWLPGADDLMNTHWKPLRDAAFRVTHDKDVAADLAQEAIIRYLEGPSVYPEKTLYTHLLQWRMLSWLRKEAKHPSVPLEKALDAIDRITARGPDALAQLVVSDEFQRIRAALDQLKAEDAYLIHRHYLLDQPTKQIAAELGISDDAVRVRIHRALVRLRAELNAG